MSTSRPMPTRAPDPRDTSRTLSKGGASAPPFFFAGIGTSSSSVAPSADPAGDPSDLMLHPDVFELAVRRRSSSSRPILDDGRPPRIGCPPRTGAMRWERTPSNEVCTDADFNHLLEAALREPLYALFVTIGWLRPGTLDVDLERVRVAVQANTRSTVCLGDASAESSAPDDPPEEGRADHLAAGRETIPRSTHSTVAARLLKGAADSNTKSLGQ
jgi:hypothetical protein